MTALFILAKVVIEATAYYGYYYGRKDGKSKCNGSVAEHEDEFNYEEFSEFMERHKIE